MKTSKWMSRFVSDQAGFTLIEILIVIVIIGILAGLATPKLMSAATKAKQVEAKQMLQQLYTLERAYRIENDQYWIPQDGAVANGQTPEAFAELGFELTRQARYEYSITGDHNHFEARALARNLDDDDTVDEWAIDQEGELKVLSNDAKN
jgi:prepilin-type N-terminal cleavage/methylation domain-containing protein